MKKKVVTPPQVEDPNEEDTSEKIRGSKCKELTTAQTSEEIIDEPGIEESEQGTSKDSSSVSKKRKKEIHS